MDSDGNDFNEHFLLIGVWKGDINSIPGFDEGKLDQFKEDDIARYAGAEYEEGEEIEVTLIPHNLVTPQLYTPIQATAH